MSLARTRGQGRNRARLAARARHFCAGTDLNDFAAMTTMSVAARNEIVLVPAPLMRKMYYTSEPVPAADLVQYGGIVELTSRDKLIERADAIAAKIASQSPRVLRVAKQTLRVVVPMSLQEGYIYEQSQTAMLTGDAEARAALSDSIRRIHQA